MNLDYQASFRVLQGVPAWAAEDLRIAAEALREGDHYRHHEALLRIRDGLEAYARAAADCCFVLNHDMNYPYLLQYLNSTQ